MEEELPLQERVRLLQWDSMAVSTEWTRIWSKQVTINHRQWI
jgi:hypothetical protein